MFYYFHLLEMKSLNIGVAYFHHLFTCNKQTMLNHETIRALNC